MTEKLLSSAQPYLIRAMHEWMTDNNQTPLMVVDAGVSGVVVPAEHIRDGRIVLNTAWSATRNLQLGNEEISFQARFGGVPHGITLPILAVLGVYARESGQGMWFQDEAEAATSADAAGAPLATVAAENQSDADESKPQRGSPNLRIVK